MFETTPRPTSTSSEPLWSETKRVVALWPTKFLVSISASTTPVFPGGTTETLALPPVQPQETRRLRIEIGLGVLFVRTNRWRTFAPRGTLPKSCCRSAKRPSAHAPARSAPLADAATQAAIATPTNARARIFRLMAASCAGLGSSGPPHGRPPAPA